MRDGDPAHYSKPELPSGVGTDAEGVYVAGRATGQRLASSGMRHLHVSVEEQLKRAASLPAATTAAGWTVGGALGSGRDRADGVGVARAGGLRLVSPPSEGRTLPGLRF